MLDIFSQRTYAIIKRELKAQIMTRAFIISTLLVPLLIFGGLGLQAFLMTYEEEKLQSIEVIVENPNLLPGLEQRYGASDDFDKTLYRVSFSVLPEEQLAGYIKQHKPTLLSGELSGIFYAGNETLSDKAIAFYSNNPKNLVVTTKIRRLLNDVMTDDYFVDKAISPEDLAFARKGTRLISFKISEAEEVVEDSYGAFIVAGVLAFLLYVSLLMIGTQIMRAVIEEKENRVVEVLLSSVNSHELMTAKIIGTTAAGLLQITIWMVPFLFLSLTSLVSLPDSLQFSISLGQIGYFIVNYGLGLITFLGLFAAVGAIFDNIAEAQQGQMPIMFLILIPFYICFTLIKDPSNIIAQVASMVPFASIMVMPVRMAIVDIQSWEIVLALVVNIVTLLFIFSFVGKIYRVGILTTGKKPTWREVYRWMKQS